MLRAACERKAIQVRRPAGRDRDLHRFDPFPGCGLLFAGADRRVRAPVPADAARWQERLAKLHPVVAEADGVLGPLPPNAEAGQGVHHINFGLRLKEQMDKLGIECIVRHQDEGPDVPQEITAFLVKHFQPGKRASLRTQSLPVIGSHEIAITTPVCTRSGAGFSVSQMTECSPRLTLWSAWSGGY